MQEIIKDILIGLGAIGGIGGLAAFIRSSVVFIRPGEIGVKVPRFHGEPRALLDSNRKETHNVIQVVADRMPAIRLPDGSYQTITPEMQQVLKTSPKVRQETRQQLNLPKGSALRVETITTGQHIAVNQVDVSRPRLGLVFKNPITERIAILDGTLRAVDTKEGDVQVPMLSDGLPVYGTPDIGATFSLMPSSAGQVLTRFSSQDALDRTVESFGRSAAVEATQGIEMGKISPAQLSQRALIAFADRLIQADLNNLVSLGTVIYQGTNFGNLASQRNDLTSQQMRQAVLGPNFGPIEQARVAASGVGSTTIIIPAASSGSDLATHIAAEATAPKILPKNS